MHRLQFMIAGVQKCGTSALDAYLRLHDRIEMARVKETHFFDDETSIDWRDPDYRTLNSYFAEASSLKGEATPITFYWTPAHYRILRYNPDMRFILLFRDPVARAWSHWKMAAAAGRDPLSFSEAIRAGRTRVLDDGGPAGLSRWLSYVERGYYARQLREFMKLFPIENILMLKQDDLIHEPAATLDRVAGFLGVPPFGAVPAMTVHESSWLQSETMKDEDQAYLQSLYEEDQAEFMAMTGMSF